jgi:hypothetical protein
VSLSAAELTAGVYVRPPDNDDTDMDIAAQAHLRATSSGITTVAAGAFIIIVDAVADLPVVTGIDPEGDSGFTGNEQEYVTVQVKATTFNDTDGSENHYIIIENIPAEWKIGESNTSLPDGWRVITNGDGNDPYPPIIGQEDNLERVVILVPSGTETVQGSIIFDPHEWTNAHNDGSPLELTIKAASWEHNLAGKELDINNNYSEVTITENYIVSIGDLKPTLSDIELDESYIKGGTLANSQPEVGALGRSASINIPDGYTVDVKGEEWTQDADAGNWALSVLDGKGELSWNGKELTFTLLKNSEHPDANEDNELLADALTLQIPLTHTATGISGINAELKIQIHDDNLAVEDSIGTLVWHKDLDTPEGYFTHKNEISLTGQSDASKEGEPKDLTFSLLDDIVSITSAKIEFTEAGTISSYTPEGVVRQHSSGIYADLPKGKEIRDDADEMDFFNDLGYAEGLVVNLTGLAFGMTLNLEKFFNMNGASGNNGEVETGMVYFYKVSNVDDEEIAELVGTMPLKSVDASGQSQLNFETVENAFNRVVITPTKPDKEDSEFCIKSVKFTTLDDFVRYDEGMAQGSTSVAGADGIKEGTFTFNISQLSQNLQTVDDDKITVTFTDTTHCVGYLGDAKAFDVVLNQYTGEWVYLQSKVFTLSEPLKLSFTVTDNDGDISTAYIQVNYDDSATSDTTDTGTFEGNTVLSSLIGDVLSDDMSQEITSILNNSNRIVSVEKEGKLSAVFSSADGDNDTLSGGTGSDIFIFESLTGGSKDTITDFEYGKDQLHFTDLLTSDDNTVASLLDNLSAETWNDEKNTLSLNLENEGTLTAEFLEGKLLLTIASSNNNGTTHEIDITFDSGSSSGTPSCTVPEDVTQAAEILKNMLENYQG